MKKQVFPRGWSEERVRNVIAYYEGQTEDEEVAEDEAAFHAAGQTTIVVPNQLVPAILRLIARHERNARPARRKRRHSAKA